MIENPKSLQELLTTKCENPACHDGWISVPYEDTTLARECECMNVKRNIWSIKRSGIEKVIDRNRFSTFKTDEPWQKGLAQSAMAYTDDVLAGSAKWFMICGQVGCVDEQTEYFNGYEWKPISEYSNGDFVLQFVPNRDGKNGEGYGELVIPTSYIKKPARTLWQIETDRGSINQCLSLNHNFAYVTTKGNINKKPFHEVIKTHGETKQGFYGKIITTFKYSGEGMPISDAELRLMVAVIADGCFKNGNLFCDINVKKERKKKRIETLLEQAKISFKKYEKRNGFTLYRFYAPRREKEYGKDWYRCTQHQLMIIADEVINWDGSQCGARRQFSTTSKQSADFIQFVFSATGTRAVITSIDRRGGIHKSIEYTVIISCNRLLSLVKSESQVNKARITEYQTKDGYQYCFTVPSGFLILRRGDRIFITGNSGKTHICTAIMRELLYEGVGARYVMWREIAMELKRSQRLSVSGYHHHDEETHDQIFGSLMRPRVLYIDDFLKGNITDSDKNFAYDIVNGRYVRDLPMIISSEKTYEEIMDVDPSIGSRIFEKTKGYYSVIRRDVKKNIRMRGEAR